MKLTVKGLPHEQLLFQLLGVSSSNVNGADSSEALQVTTGILLGKNELPPLAPDGKDIQLYLRLPDTANPHMESNRLASLLAHAIGQGEIHL